MMTAPAHVRSLSDATVSETLAAWEQAAREISPPAGVIRIDIRVATLAETPAERAERELAESPALQARLRAAVESVRRNGATLLDLSDVDLDEAD